MKRRRKKEGTFADIRRVTGRRLVHAYVNPRGANYLEILNDAVKRLQDSLTRAGP